MHVRADLIPEREGLTRQKRLRAVQRLYPRLEQLHVLADRFQHDASPQRFVERLRLHPGTGVSLSAYLPPSREHVLFARKAGEQLGLKACLLLLNIIRVSWANVQLSIATQRMWVNEKQLFAFAVGSTNNDL